MSNMSKKYFSKHYITLKNHFLCSLRITIELGSKSQYFGINELNKSRGFDIEAYTQIG